MRLKFITLVATAALGACSNNAGFTSQAPAPLASTDAAKAADLSNTAKMPVEQIVKAMTLEHKIAQLIMPDISAITPSDMQAYRFGTILNGGNSGPGGNDKAAAPAWLELADAYWNASVAPLPNAEPVIPALWATDAVHGHSNIPTATMFPHNIGLGATHDADLMERIGRATAAEIAATGIDWTFAPTLAVATDDRWGRTYESFSQDPALVARLGAAMIEGLQGKPGSNEFLDQNHVLATAKHFFGDGGTGGKDRGDTKGAMDDLKRTHLAPYPPAFAAGAKTVMASFSSVNGVKMHGSKDMLTGILRNDLGFDGLVVGDWNGHGELNGCTNTDCPQSLMAGLDIFMVPEDWKGLYETLLRQARDGTIPMSRVDEAVTRILRVKEAVGAFDRPAPSARSMAGKFDVLGSPEHRAIAREAVRKSLVLLKNDGVLPIKSSANIVVDGPGADSVPMQSGGWSITWQGGGDLTNADFPGATSIFGGIAAAMKEGNGTAHLAGKTAQASAPDAAIVVFGEEPYAEFVGDRDDLAFRDEQGLELLETYKNAGIPTVAVFLSGRPLWVNRELSIADAFVAAWLPGSEGDGIADVLIGTPDGDPRYDFTGKLAFDWPAGCAPGSDSLFALGSGGSYAEPPATEVPGTTCALLKQGFADGLKIFERGLNQSVSVKARDGSGETRIANLVGTSASGALRLTGFDRAAQEDARRVEFKGPAQLGFSWSGDDLPKDSVLMMRVKVEARPIAALTLKPIGTDSGKVVDMTASFDLASGKDWRTIHVPLRCLADSGLSGFTLESVSAFVFDLDLIGIVPQVSQQDCTGPF